jgi:hypothetical protein
MDMNTPKTNNKPIAIWKISTTMAIGACLLFLLPAGIAVIYQPPSLESNARTFGHQLASSIKSGYSYSNLYAFCSITGQEKGYHGDELERFINIAERQALQ